MRKIKAYFDKKLEVAAVYLYGSFAKKKAKKNSDIDLGVIFKKKKIKPFTSPELVMAVELSHPLKKEVEIQDLELCRIDFAHRVITEGRLIHSKDEAKRISFEEKVLREYFSLKPLLEEYYRCLSLIAQKGELDARYL